MKKLIIIEDLPWRLEKGLSELMQKGVQIEKILFFKRSGVPTEDEQERIYEMQNILNIDIEKINITTFNSVVDTYYKMDDVSILMDYDLKDESVFEKRINISYAYKKENKGRGKLWFYTNGGKDFKSMILKNLGKNQVVDVEDFYAGQLYLNTEQIMKIVASSGGVMEAKIIELRQFVQFDFYTVNELFVLQLFEPNTCPNDIGVSCIWEDSHSDIKMLFDIAIEWCKIL